MRGAISTVRRNVHLDASVGFDVVIVLSESSDRHIIRKNDNARVVGSDPNLVLGANHAMRGNTAQLRGLDGELLVAIIKDSADCGDNNLLTCSDICSAANNIERLGTTDINFSHVKMIRIGMRLASQNLANDKTLKAALDALRLLHAVDLEADGGKKSRELFWGKIKIDVAFQPIV